MNQSTLMEPFVNQFLLVSILLSSPLLFAGPAPYDPSKQAPPPPPPPWCETPPTLEIRIGVPGWLAGISGDTGVKGIVASSDVSFSQLFSHLTHVPIALSADIRYKRWEFYGDGQYMVVGTSA